MIIQRGRYLNVEQRGGGVKVRICFTSSQIVIDR